MSKLELVTFRAVGCATAGTPLEGVSAKPRILLSHLEDNTVSTSWMREEERKGRSRYMKRGETEDAN